MARPKIGQNAGACLPRPLGSQKASTSNPSNALRQQLIIAASKLQLSHRAVNNPLLGPSANGILTPAIW